jgi:hypothetical protein
LVLTLPSSLAPYKIARGASGVGASVLSYPLTPPAVGGVAGVALALNSPKSLSETDVASSWAIGSSSNGTSGAGITLPSKYSTSPGTMPPSKYVKYWLIRYVTYGLNIVTQFDDRDLLVPAPLSGSLTGSPFDLPPNSLVGMYAKTSVAEYERINFSDVRNGDCVASISKQAAITSITYITEPVASKVTFLVDDYIVPYANSSDQGSLDVHFGVDPDGQANEFNDDTRSRDGAYGSGMDANQSIMCRFFYSKHSAGDWINAYNKVLVRKRINDVARSHTLRIY